MDQSQVEALVVQVLDRCRDDEEVRRASIGLTIDPLAVADKFGVPVPGELRDHLMQRTRQDPVRSRTAAMNVLSGRADLPEGLVVRFGDPRQPNATEGGDPDEPQDHVRL